VRNNGQVSPIDESAPARQEAAPGGDRGRPRRGRIVLFAVVAATALALDVVSKVLVAANLRLGHPPVRILDGLFYLDQTRNAGAAWGMGTGFTIVLTLIALGVVAIIVRTARRMRSTGWAVALGLVLGGALGNLADRIFRAPGIGRGYVVDWISIFGPNGKYWPIFNLADSAIVCGAILAGILAISGIEMDPGGSRARDRE
jgi:signal peptidase II